MNAVEMIATALIVGTSVGAKDTASVAVKDAYESLKGLVRRRAGGSESARKALEGFESNPTDRNALNEALTDSSADADPDIVESARVLLQLLQQSNEFPAGIDLGQAKGVQVGNGNVQNNTFS